VLRSVKLSIVFVCRFSLQIFSNTLVWCESYWSRNEPFRHSLIFLGFVVYLWVLATSSLNSFSQWKTNRLQNLSNVSIVHVNRIGQGTNRFIRWYSLALWSGPCNVEFLPQFFSVQKRPIVCKSFAPNTLVWSALWIVLVKDEPFRHSLMFAAQRGLQLWVLCNVQFTQFFSQ
jgi:hypothetical protein